MSKAIKAIANSLNKIYGKEMNPFKTIIGNLHKLQQNINFVPQETATRKTKRLNFTYEQ